MFKIQRKLDKAHLKPRKVSHRGGSNRLEEVEGNSNTTLKRMTIPLDFQSLEYKLEVARKNTSKRNVVHTSDHNLHRVNKRKTCDNFKKPRRSARLSKRFGSMEDFENSCQGGQISPPISPVFSYNNNRNFKSVFREIQEREASQLGGEVTPAISPVFSRNKSIFQEINERCARAKEKAVKKGNLSPTISVLMNDIVKPDVNQSYCDKLREQISVNFKRNKLVDCAQKIQQEIVEINEIVAGKSQPVDLESINYKQVANLEDVVVEDFVPIPRCEWVYKTPPKQKIRPPKVKCPSIQPAVIYTSRKQSTIYEFNSPAVYNLDISEKDVVGLDSRHLKRVASFDLSPCLFDVNPGRRHGEFFKFCQEINSDAGGEKMPELFNVVERPLKIDQKNPRHREYLKSKQSTPFRVFGPSEANCSNILEPSDDFTFVEDNGSFKMLKTQHAMNGGEFNFKRNIFREINNENRDMSRAFRFEDSALPHSSQSKALFDFGFGRVIDNN